MIEAIIIMKTISYVLLAVTCFYFGFNFAYKAVQPIIIFVQANSPQKRYQENMFRY